MKFEFSKHSLDQMIRRDLSKEQVQLVIEQPDFVEVQYPDIKVYSKVFFEKSKAYLYRVFMNELKKPALIITVYKTSKTDKYANKI
jgi:hypothetical protein